MFPSFGHPFADPVTDTMPEPLPEPTPEPTSDIFSQGFLTEDDARAALDNAGVHGEIVASGTAFVILPVEE